MSKVFLATFDGVAACRTAAPSSRLRSTLLGAMLFGLAACKKDEPPPPLPEPPKPAETTAEAPLELMPEDAGKPPEPVVDKTKTGVKKPSGGLKQCCVALRQNAESAPEPTKGYMIYAAGVCDLAATSGQDKASMLNAVRTALRGAGMPADCK
jgi:hypothetical protein